MSAWPLTNNPLRDSYKDRADWSPITSEMEFGPAKRRPRVTNPMHLVELQFLLNDTEKGTLDAFFDSQAEVAFDWTEQVTGQTKQARFMEPPSYDSREGEYWTASVKLEYL